MKVKLPITSLQRRGFRAAVPFVAAAIVAVFCVGFKIIHAYDHWGSSWMLRNYCVVFEKLRGRSEPAR
ncbi:MAG: hypothetical protein WA740_14880 [Candidatus Binataceae bacterium]